MKELDIGEVAKRSGIQPSTLRFYEKKGLIRPVGRNGLRRQYHESVLDRLQLIVLGQAAGFSLQEIAEILTPGSVGDASHDRFSRRAKEIDATIRKLRILSQGLKHIAYCTAPQHTECAEFKKIVGRGLRLIK
ncbi:helix-turn-helix domain-containing protein [Nissabacter sp. SGAir0207]|uniref:helix-turn-helix domain-containing protein n=1 Tax=Nissabacter sp. SGAir0207 TaxID=2126321 RepID=UPI0010CCCA89|nr:helix-turn-helix domain-containing protein [Nissabacter sp. SGAir0207]QCR38695.1 transcriptional regulator [Nissabacter sp. SGAir0207]